MLHHRRFRKMCTELNYCVTLIDIIAKIIKSSIIINLRIPKNAYKVLIFKEKCCCCLLHLPSKIKM